MAPSLYDLSCWWAVKHLHNNNRNKINEATFFIHACKKKDRCGAFETDEGGPEKHFFGLKGYFNFCNEYDIHLIK